MGRRPRGSVCCRAPWGSPTCNHRVAAEARKLSCLVTATRLNKQDRCHPAGKGMEWEKAVRLRTSEASTSWAFPEGLWGDTPNESHQGCWFHHLSMFLVLFPELPSPRTPRPGPSLLELFPGSSPHPQRGSSLLRSTLRCGSR